MISEKDWNITTFQWDIQFFIIIQEYKDVFEDFSEVISLSSDLNKKKTSEVNRKTECIDKTVPENED